MSLSILLSAVVSLIFVVFFCRNFIVTQFVANIPPDITKGP